MLMARQLEVIPEEECRGLLASRSVGRLVFVDGGRPQIVPVNYALHDGTVIVRTQDGGALGAAPSPAVAFEVDAIDADHHTGWSVVVHGEAEEIWRPEELAALRQLSLRPWAPGHHNRYVRIRPHDITGRRIS